MLLKRGQPPPPSCMLLGGGAGPPPCTAPGANPNNAQVTGTLLQNESGTAPGKPTLGPASERGKAFLCLVPDNNSMKIIVDVDCIMQKMGEDPSIKCT